MVSRRRELTPQLIRSRSNPAFKRMRALQAGFDAPTILVEGQKLIDEALVAGLVPLQLWTEDKLLMALDCPTYQVPASLYRSLSPTKSGRSPLAVFNAPALARPSPEQLKQGRFLLLDRIQEPGNGGSLVRAAAAFGLDGVLWCEPCVNPYHHASIRASAGAVFHLPQFLLTEANLAHLTLPLIGTGLTGAGWLGDYRWPVGFILAMGNEGHGLSPVLLTHLATSINIQVDPRIESLNVAGAAHILLYHQANQRRREQANPEKG